MEIADEIFENIKKQYEQNIEKLKQNQLEIDRLMSKLEESQIEIARLKSKLEEGKIEIANTKENYREAIEDIIKKFEKRLISNNEKFTKTIDKLNKENERLLKENKELKERNKKDFLEKENPQKSFCNGVDFHDFNLEEQEYYLHFYDCADIIDRISGVKYLYISIDLSGTVWLYNASNYKNAPIIQIDSVKLLPNPYYFSEFSDKNEQKGRSSDRGLF